MADFLTKPLGKVKLASFLPQVSLGSSPTGDKEKMTTTKKTVVKAKMMTVSEMAANTLAKTLANAMATARASGMPIRKMSAAMKARGEGYGVRTLQG